MGYYTKYKGTWHAVANAFEMWFELRRQEGTFEAFQVACLGMSLTHLLMNGIDINTVTLLGEEILTPTQRLTSVNDLIKEESLQSSF